MSWKTTIKYNFPIFTSFYFIVLHYFYDIIQKNVYYSLHILLVLPKAASLWGNDEEEDFVFFFGRNESTATERVNEWDRGDRGRELELAVVWKRQHTRLYGGLLDNRHCAPAITRNRTRQHHASIVRVSASILLLSRFLLFSVTLSHSSYISFISFHSSNLFFFHLLAYLDLRLLNILTWYDVQQT